MEDADAVGTTEEIASELTNLQDCFEGSSDTSGEEGSADSDIKETSE